MYTVWFSLRLVGGGRAGRWLMLTDEGLKHSVGPVSAPLMVHRAAVCVPHRAGRVCKVIHSSGDAIRADRARRDGTFNTDNTVC